MGRRLYTSTWVLAVGYWNTTDQHLQEAVGITKAVTYADIDALGKINVNNWFVIVQSNTFCFAMKKKTNLTTFSMRITEANKKYKKKLAIILVF